MSKFSVNGPKRDLLKGWVRADQDQGRFWSCEEVDIFAAWVLSIPSSFLLYPFPLHRLASISLLPPCVTSLLSSRGL